MELRHRQGPVWSFSAGGLQAPAACDVTGLLGCAVCGGEAAPLYLQDAGSCGALEGSTVHLLQVDVFF